jgi:peptidoglycan/xylan/chitin deacetylase (PgdA/CDA1 family)
LENKIVKFPKAAALALVLVSVTVFAQNKRSETAARIAITFDALPAHGPLPPGTTRLQVASKILDALRAAGVPPTYGFVNGIGTERQPADLAVLEAWRAAGQPLGNHAWSHMNLNQHSTEEYEADILKNEDLLGRLSGTKDKEDWHWFRYPYLAEGDTPAKKATIRAFLSQHGYKVAAVTMSFGDYLWNEPYARCKEKNDAKAISAMEESFLSAADESISYYRGLWHTLYGRDIPYVLLMHIGALDAEMLPRLLQLYKSRGFQFVPLAEAEADEFYRNSVDLRLPAGPDMLDSAMIDRGQPLPARISLAPLLDAICR